MVYKATTAPLVQDVIKGYNAAVFAYGATGSGKTHTMLGPCRKKGATPTEADGQTSDSGLMVRAIEEIFQYIEMSEDPASCKVSQPQWGMKQFSKLGIAFPPGFHFIFGNIQ